MNLHITPSFNIDRLCKTASVLLFLVYLLSVVTFYDYKLNVTYELVDTDAKVRALYTFL